MDKSNLIFVLDQVKTKIKVKTLNTEFAKSKLRINVQSMISLRDDVASDDRVWSKREAKQRLKFLGSERFDTEDWVKIRMILQLYSKVILVVPFFPNRMEDVQRDARKGVWSENTLFVMLTPYDAWVAPKLDSEGNIAVNGYMTWRPDKTHIAEIWTYDEFIDCKVYFEEPEEYCEMRSYNDFCDFEVINLVKESTIDQFERLKLTKWELTKSYIVNDVVVSYNKVLSGTGRSQSGLLKDRSVTSMEINHNRLMLYTFNWLKENDHIDVYESLNVGVCPVCDHKTRMSVASKCNFCGYTLTRNDLLEAGVEDATAFVSPEALSTDRHEVFSRDVLNKVLLNSDIDFNKDDAESDIYEDDVYFDEDEDDE